MNRRYQEIKYLFGINEQLGEKRSREGSGRGKGRGGGDIHFTETGEGAAASEYKNMHYFCIQLPGRVFTSESYE